MTRGIDALQQAGTSGKRVAALFFARLVFPTTPMYVHNGIGPIIFGGNTYTGIYDYAIFDSVEETIENRPADIKIGIQRVPVSAIDPVINEKYHGKPAYLYYSAADAAGQPVSTPFEIFRGTMDKINLNVTAEGITYLLTCKNIMSNWDRTKTRRITDAEQQRRYPGDTAYRHLAGNEDKQVSWGPDGATKRQSGSPPKRGSNRTYER